jgi:hypothetical protein
MGLKWGSPYKKVKKRFPKMRSVDNPCYFDGVNVFGRDSTQFFEEVFTDNSMNKRVFVFYRRRLVAVDLHYGSMDLKAFNKKLVRRLKKNLSRRRLAYRVHNDQTKVNHYYIWNLKGSIIVAMHGHFKNVVPDNLDWVRIKYYYKSFYELKKKNQKKLAGSGRYEILF